MRFSGNHNRHNIAYIENAFRAALSQMEAAMLKRAGWLDKEGWAAPGKDKDRTRSGPGSGFKD